MRQPASRAVDCAFEFAKSPTEVPPLLHRKFPKLEKEANELLGSRFTRASRWSKLGKFGCKRTLVPGNVVATTDRGQDFGEPAEELTRPAG